MLPDDLLRAAAAEFTTIPPDAWVQYDSPDERGKRTFNRLDQMPPACRQAFYALLSAATVSRLEALTGLEGLQPDPSIYGGGLHETEPGGFLGLHLDNERHPESGLVRRLNLIVYLNEGWREEWGGHLELWDRQRRQAVKRILPEFGRIALFETSNWSFHGQTEPLACPPGITRKSLCVFYYSAPRARARFVAPNGEHEDEPMRAWRVVRSMKIEEPADTKTPRDTL